MTGCSYITLFFAPPEAGEFENTVYELVDVGKSCGGIWIAQGTTEGVDYIIFKCPTSQASDLASHMSHESGVLTYRLYDDEIHARAQESVREVRELLAAAHRDISAIAGQRLEALQDAFHKLGWASVGLSHSGLLECRELQSIRDDDSFRALVPADLFDASDTGVGAVLRALDVALPRSGKCYGEFKVEEEAEDA